MPTPKPTPNASHASWSRSAKPCSSSRWARWSARTPGQASSESAAIPRTCFPWASSPAPPHGLGRDGFVDASFDRESLQVREAFLQRKPLLVKVLPRPPELERNLPAGLLLAIDDREDLLEPAPVMRGQRIDALGDV